MLTTLQRARLVKWLESMPWWRELPYAQFGPALQKIADIPPVPYKIDRLEHCSTTIEEMVRLAKTALGRNNE